MRRLQRDNPAVTPSLDEQIAEIKREIALRKSVYPRWIKQGKMTQAQADGRLACLEATLDLLRDQRVPLILPDPL